MIFRITLLALLAVSAFASPQYSDNSQAPGVAPDADSLEQLQGFIEGNALTTEQMAAVAETLGGIVVYIFSYLFMGMIFLSYICGVIVLLIFKIMFGGFVPVATVGYGYQGGAMPEARSLGEYQRMGRVLQPYSANSNIDYNGQLGMYDKTIAFANRGVATGKYLYDVVMSPECQQYILCQASATFGDEQANNLRFKDVMRTVAAPLDYSKLDKGRSTFARAVNVGSATGECVTPNSSFNCPALEPAFGKMNDLLSFFGVRPARK